MWNCNPHVGERYYLRLLLTRVPGATSYEDIRNFNGVQYDTFHGACVARGLAENDQEFIDFFNESKLYLSGHALRALFVEGLLYSTIGDPPHFWDLFKADICDDLKRELERRNITWDPLLADPHLDYGLFLIQRLLSSSYKALQDYFLPCNTFDWARALELADSEFDINYEKRLADEMKAQLNADQLACFQTITNAIENDPQTAHFYLQGPGGTGKTFLYKTICHYYRGLGKTVLCTASTGLAALLLPGGRTAHSHFKIPVENLDENSHCAIRKNSKIGDLLKKVDLVIWDEVPMQHKHAFECVHRLFTDLRDTDDDVLFGGVPVILGGDFAQTLPIVPRGSRADTVTACLQRSFIWQKLRFLKLRINMRVRNGTHDQDFIQWIDSLPYDPALHGPVSIPLYLSQPKSLTDLVEDIYPCEILRTLPKASFFQERCLLTVRNDTVTELNDLVLDSVPGEAQEYLSMDSTNRSEEGIDDVPVE